MDTVIKRKRRRDSNSGDDDDEANGSIICHNMNLHRTSSTNRIHVACLLLLLLWALVVTGVVLILLSSSLPVKSSYQSRRAERQKMHMNRRSQLSSISLLTGSEMTKSMSSSNGILRRRNLRNSEAATIHHDANEWLLQRERQHDSEREGENRIKKSQNRREQEYDKYEPSKTGAEMDDDNPFDHWNSNTYGRNGTSANVGYYNATGGNYSSDMKLSKPISSGQQPAFQNVIVYHNLISLTVYAALPAYSKSVGWTISDMVTDYLNQTQSSPLGELCNFYFTHPTAEMNLPSQASLATPSGQDDDLGNLDNGSPVNGPKIRSLLNQALWGMHYIDQRARLYLVVDDVWWWEVRYLALRIALHAKAISRAVEI